MKARKKKEAAALKADGVSIIWPLAGLLHDYELVRLYDK